ncbi:LuxR family transcriptional regulator [Novosphingobium flavum]|uniref:LuxR family transcriptional regulator n=1 Tax=Novosphingobium aerophilum TaxID=2839843 RepID=A0A7X1F9I5_9SPHN|nr:MULTISPECIES: LuxR C-terminal-related transcriptional regulator [Novosphingobium]MBC2652890.1 LuxR family transcriptional regulator [Novosphingobium aerophilum]MBC2663053.1 LuxR family transcriptional regulator [Novosphingobium aerophilum]
MAGISKLVLVDTDYRRRAAVSHDLAGSDIHVEPFDGADDLIAHWPSAGVLLIHDNGTALNQVVAFMARTGNWLPCICYAEQPDPRRVALTVLAGAIDYLPWPLAQAELRHALDEAAERARLMSSSKLREAVARSRLDRLTRREREVLEAVASGLSNRKIGEVLAISPRTVEIHRANMLSKLGANHTAEAIRIAIEASLPASSDTIAA